MECLLADYCIFQVGNLALRLRTKRLLIDTTPTLSAPQTAHRSHNGTYENFSMTQQIKNYVK